MPSLVAVTELVVVVACLAFLEEDLHALCHVDSQEHVRVADDGCDYRQGNCLGDGVCGQILLAEDLHFEVPLHDECAIQATEDSDDEVEEDFEKVPALVVFHLEHDELAGSKGVHCLQNDYQYETLVPPVCVDSQQAPQ